MKSKHQEIADAWVECKNAWTERDEAVKSLAAVTAERDSLKHAVEQAERALMEIGACSCEIGADVERLVHAHRCALLAKEQATDKLAALKKRVADAPKGQVAVMFADRRVIVKIPLGWGGGTRIALVRLEDGE